MSALQYKGVNLSGLEFGSGIGTINTTYVMPSQSYYSYWAQSVDSNIIRLPFTWERLQPQLGGPLDQKYLSYLQDSVSYAKANGMTIILDLHNYGRYNGNLATASQLTDVWTKLAQVFKNDSSVWFDLMNEPHDVSATQWADITQQTVNALRASGIDNKLLLEGTSWSGAHSWVSSGNAAAFANFKDPANNYAYDVHQYLDSDSSGTSATAVSGSGSTRLVSVTDWATSTGQKLFLGEAGLANNAGSETEMKAMINYMESHSEAWLGFTLWGAGPWWPQNYVFDINPTGLGTGNVMNKQSIQDLMSYLAPAEGGTGENQPPAANQPPVAHADDFTGTKNVAVSGNVLADNGHGADHDPDSNPLSVTPATLTTAQGGKVVLASNGNFTYTPASNYTGADSFKYTLLDGQGGQAQGTVSITLKSSTAANQPPVAQPDDFSGQQYRTVSGNVLANNGHGVDSDPEGQALSVVAGQMTTANGGTVALNSNGTFAYTPASSFYGTDSFTYTLKDSAGLTAPGTVKINVNSAPVAHPDDFTGTKNAALSGNVLADNGHGADHDPVAGDVLSVTPATLTTAQGGKVVLASNGNFTYTPASNYTGADSFKYNLLDNKGGQAEGTVSIVINQSATTTPPTTTPPSSPSTVYGTEGNDKIDADKKTGTTIRGLGGDDYLIGHDGNDILDGGDGNDRLYGYWGNDTLLGGKGSDTLSGGVGADTFVFKAADLGAGVDTILDFSVAQGDKIDIADVLRASYDPSKNVLADFVRISTSGGNSVLSVDLTGHAGSSGWTKVATISGVTGITDKQLIVSDSLPTGELPTTGLVIDGTSGNDKIDADKKTGTTIRGLGGDDYLIGHDGNDILDGGDGNDRLYGYWGNDTLLGGKGSDTLSGGVGADTFVFKAADLGAGVDTILDFSKSQGDKIDIADVLKGYYDPLKGVLTDYVHISTSGSNSVLSVDLTGHAGASGWTQVATISGVTGLTDEQALVTNGHLIVT